MIEAANAQQGWDLFPHAQDQIDAAIVHFEGLIGEDGRIVRPLTKDEQRWIQNERKLCALDFTYWLRYAWIVDLNKKPVHPTLNIGQRMTLDIWAEHEERAIAIILMHLKARQLGISTLYELANCHRFQFFPNSNTIIASADPKKTVEMGQMIKYCLDNQPWWLMPSSPKDVQEKNMTVGFALINSRISIEAGNKFHGLARGATPDGGHLSEISSWPNAEEDIDAAFIRAIHETPNVFIGLESTALGKDNWFHDTWHIIKEDWPRGRSRIRGLFLPWFVGTDLYPMPSDLWRFRQMTAEGWTPNDRTVKHAERAREYVLSNPLLLKHLAKGDRSWQMPLEQMWFYEIERDTALKKKTLNKFLSEMPADDNEAFQNTGLSCIDQDVILNYREKVRHPLGVYAIVGEGIHQSLIPSRTQWWTGPDAPPVITVRCSGVVRTTETFQFIPLKFEGYPGYDPMGKLFIYEWPEDGEMYGIGVDTSDGIGQDWTVMEVMRKSTIYKPWAQAAEFASPYIKAEQLTPFALALGCFYSVYNPKAARRTQCRMAVECRGNGDIVQSGLKVRGWVNNHPWKKYDTRKPIPDGRVHHDGVFTNVSFRAAMMDKLLTVLDEEALEIGSPWFVNEMANLERDVDEKSARAAYSTHDDRIMAAGFAIFSLEPPDYRGKRFRRATPQYVDDSLDQSPNPYSSTGYPIWQPGTQTRDVHSPPTVSLEVNRKGTLTVGKYRSNVGGGF